MSKKPDKTEMLSVPKKEWERWKFSGFSYCGQGWGQVCVWEADRAAEGGPAVDECHSPLPITWDFCVSGSLCEERLLERGWAVCWVRR